jgi:thiol-disulfide isomerase/thioredoxin
MNKKAKGKRQRAKINSSEFVFSQSYGALISTLRAAFVICILCAVSFAQAVEKKPKTAEALPKVTQINETQIAELLKPNGKPLLVNFWATWCVPCREEFPDLVEIDNEFKGKINVITISLDELSEINRDVPKFLNEMKATMPTYLLYTNKESEVISSVSKDWQGGLPFTILYDANGKTIHTKMGKIKPEIVKAKINESLMQNSKNDAIENETSEIGGDVSEQDYFIDLNLDKVDNALEKGKADARKAVSEGKLAVIDFGLPAMYVWEGKEILQKKYGIYVHLGGCIVDEKSGLYTNGYNQISKVAIKKKYGKGFLTKIWKEAEDQMAEKLKTP